MEILRIPMELNHAAGKIIWHYERSINYTVKSVYRLVTYPGDAASTSTPHNPLWNSLWILALPPKTKVFFGDSYAM